MLCGLGIQPAEGLLLNVPARKSGRGLEPSLVILDLRLGEEDGLDLLPSRPLSMRPTRSTTRFARRCAKGSRLKSTYEVFANGKVFLSYE